MYNWNTHPTGESGTLRTAKKVNTFEAYFFCHNNIWFARLWSSVNRYTSAIVSNSFGSKEAAIAFLEKEINCNE